MIFRRVAVRFIHNSEEGDKIMKMNKMEGTAVSFLLVIAFTAKAMAAPVDLRITDFMFGMGHPVPPDDTWRPSYQHGT